MDDVASIARPLRSDADLDALLERIGSARFVLIGEASHGTHEYYAWRAALTRRLIAEMGFGFVAVEGDWPDCQRIDRAVRGGPPTVRGALEAFDRWPTWMWANSDVLDFAEWLRAHNAGQPVGEQVGFHGLDVYSLWESLRAILSYLEKHEPEHVETARRAFRCFEPYREDPQEYAWATRYLPASCEERVVDLLVELCRDRDDGTGAERFEAEQNAAAAAGAERYYRTMVRGGPDSWNVRDVHMADTLDRLAERYGPDSRGVVWEHNTHVGDARFTDMGRAGMVNVGQLARERHGEADVVLVGFAGYRGSVIAGDAWGSAAERMPVPPAREGSLEALLHGAGIGPSLLLFDERSPGWTRQELDHRAIGVVYHPQREQWGNYVPTVTGRRYDALLYLPETEALRPLERDEPAHGEKEAFPSGV